jgi:hypothetical protein
MYETLPKMAKKTKEKFIVQSFESYGTCKMSFAYECLKEELMFLF